LLAIAPSSQELEPPAKPERFTFLITHRSTDLADGPDLYQTFKTKKDGCVKVVFHPA
jgi:hypothetical protein